MSMVLMKMPPSTGRRGRQVADGVGVLRQLLTRQEQLFPLPDAIEAGEGVEVAEWVITELLAELGLDGGAALAQGDGEIVGGLDRESEERAGRDGDGHAQVAHLLERQPGRHAGLVVEHGPPNVAAGSTRP